MALKRLISIEELPDFDTNTHTHLDERFNRSSRRRELVVANVADLEHDNPPAKCYRKRSGVTAQYTSVGAQRWGSALDMANVVDPESLNVEDRVIAGIDMRRAHAEREQFHLRAEALRRLSLAQILERADAAGLGRPRSFVPWDTGKWVVRKIDGRDQWVLISDPHPARGKVLDLGAWLDARRAALREAA